MILQKLTHCELQFPFQPSSELVVAKRQVEELDDISPLLEQQYEVAPMGFLKQIEQGEQTQMPTTIAPNIEDPNLKFINPKIEFALEKIKKRPRSIQRISQMLSAYVGDEHAITCSTPNRMYSVKYVKGLSYVELLQLFCNDCLDDGIIHLFAI
ncbi:hypothetical protein E3N88_26040 [Mikania micrantha]|uniref:Uncharacterized protein n=1 Tax=Mikania micrantha TaxID=192012 RepID=A0A5N6N976_9ASTR|nr:hypothetical protein E3N88_26040 [Mikania micrantha]